MSRPGRRTCARLGALLAATWILGCHGAAAPASGDMGDMPGMPGMSMSAAGHGGGAIAPSASAAAMMGLRVVAVRSGTAAIARRAPVSVSPDPARAVQVTSPTGGRVLRLSTPAPGGTVRRGDVLAELQDPGVHAILQELRVARALEGPWREAAASRARAAGVPESDVAAVLAGGAVPDAVAVRAPRAARVAELAVGEGSWVAPGGLLAVLTDPADLLLELVVDGEPPPPGTSLTLRDAAGGAAGTATVVGALPEASVAGVRVRALPDRGATAPAAALAPGRALVAEWSEVTPETLWVPVSALIDTGTRRVVFVQTPDGFVSREVEPGVRAGDEVAILSGLSAGDPVAASGAFLLDSETQIGTMGHPGHGG